MTLAEIGLLMRDLGGWGVSAVLLYALKKIYDDKEAAAKKYSVEKDENFKMILSISENMAEVLATNTETSRALSANLHELRDRFLSNGKAGAGSRTLLAGTSEDGRSHGDR